MAEEAQALRRVAVQVHDGVVTVEVDGDPCRQLVKAFALTVPGMVEIRSRRPGQPS